MGSSTARTRAKRSGSFSRSHRIFGPWKPVRAALPVMRRRRSRPTAASSAFAAAPVRWSFQSSAGRMTACASSRKTAPCIWPASPIPATGSPCAATTARNASTVASHHAAGSCSVHPGCGVRSGYAAVALAITAPRSSMRTARTPVVPRSTPIVCALIPGTQRRRAPNNAARTASRRAGRKWYGAVRTAGPQKR